MAEDEVIFQTSRHTKYLVQCYVGATWVTVPGEWGSLGGAFEELEFCLWRDSDPTTLYRIVKRTY